MADSKKSVNEIIPDPSDALEFKRVKQTKPKRKSLFNFFGGIILIGLTSGVLWFFYSDQLFSNVRNELPIVRAAEGPVKVRPKTPGGMAIPDRDKLVYDRMNGNVEEPRLERLLSKPEMPKTPPVPVAKSADKKSKSGSIQNVKDINDQNETAKKSSINGIANLTKKPDLVPKQDDVFALSKQKIISKSSPKISSASSPLVSSIAYQVQLAAVRSPERAKSEWFRLKSKHADLLKDYSLKVVRADLGSSKGVFFRLRAGPIDGEGAAKKLCENLSKRKVGCLIVRPGG